MNFWLKWRIWRGSERTQATVMVALAITAGFLAAFLINRYAGGGEANRRRILGYWAFVALSLKAWIILSAVYYALRSRARRPSRFHVQDEAFTVPTLRAQWVAATDHVLFGGFLIGIGVDFLLPDDQGVRTGGLAVVCLITMAAVATFTYFAVRPAWRGNVLELTPTGIAYRTPFTERVVPWEALKPGQPTRRPLRSALLQLAVAKPELVVQEGPSLGESGKRRLWLPMEFDIHPWFLTDAIRYYIGHPASRKAIGTEAEHERLKESFAMAQ